MTTLKYKVGDKLKVKDYCKYSCINCLEHTGWIEIKKVGGIYYYNAYNEDGMFVRGCKGCYQDVHIEGYYNPVDTKKSHTFKVGDRVRIRQWDDMVNEFGISGPSVYINTRTRFAYSMRYLCGAEATIKSIEDNDVELTDFSVIDCDNNWIFDIDMFEPVKTTTKQSKWTPEPAKYHNGTNWLTKSTVCIDGKEMPVEEFKAKTTLYRSALAAYNNYFPTK